MRSKVNNLITLKPYQRSDLITSLKTSQPHLFIRSLALEVVEDYFAHSHGFWGDLDVFVGFDVFEGFFE